MATQQQVPHQRVTGHPLVESAVINLCFRMLLKNACSNVKSVK